MTTPADAYPAGAVRDTKKHDDLPDAAILADRIERLTTVMAASTQGHFQRNLVA